MPAPAVGECPLPQFYGSPLFLLVKPFPVAQLTRLDNARIPVQVDVGFGDAVNSGLLDYPTLLPMPAPRVLAYPMNAVVAETGGYCQPRHSQQPHEGLLRYLVPRTNIPVPGGGSRRDAKSHIRTAQNEAGPSRLESPTRRAVRRRHEASPMAGIPWEEQPHSAR